ncbi:hypothetical protein EX30DRAFT_339827 [Ascodesmis nigricans]|uniref:Uncharacterized protein n=1 Tax=Ascodesmis nigricans TaxID=341454 RepID=A0A4S2N0H8_9PEZI|nr:hypothetical protein EX30DRAFT_339827 [Ascodesmis nigricans]
MTHQIHSYRAFSASSRYSLPAPARESNDIPSFRPRTYSPADFTINTDLANNGTSQKKHHPFVYQPYRPDSITPRISPRSTPRSSFSVASPTQAYPNAPSPTRPVHQRAVSSSTYSTASYSSRTSSASPALSQRSDSIYSVNEEKPEPSQFVANMDRKFTGFLGDMPVKEKSTWGRLVGGFKKSKKGKK